MTSEWPSTVWCGLTQDEEYIYTVLNTWLNAIGYEMKMNMSCDCSSGPEKALLSIVVRKQEKKNTVNVEEGMGKYGIEGGREEDRWEKYIWKMTKITEHYFAYYFTIF